MSTITRTHCVSGSHGKKIRGRATTAPGLKTEAVLLTAATSHFHPCLLQPDTKMMPAKLVNVGEADFGPASHPADTMLFSDTFVERPGLPTRTEMNQKLPLPAAMHIAKVLGHQNSVLSNLDDWMTAFAKWMLTVGFPSDRRGAKQKEFFSAAMYKKKTCLSCHSTVSHFGIVSAIFDNLGGRVVHFV